MVTYFRECFFLIFRVQQFLIKSAVYLTTPVIYETNVCSLSEQVVIVILTYMEQVNYHNKNSLSKTPLILARPSPRFHLKSPIIIFRKF